MIPVYILTNDNHLWLLNGFQYLWNKYCGMPVVIFGFKQPARLTPNFHFVSLGSQLPAPKWSDGLLKMLDYIGHKHFILMLEDYWLYESVDHHRINALGRLMDNYILRIDLAGNRASYKQAIEIDDNLVETHEGTPYQMSFQTAIWHKENLRKVLRKGENPWEAEIKGSERVGNLRVLGTKKALLKYQPVWRTKQNRWQLDKLSAGDVDYIRKKGWLNPT